MATLASAGVTAISLDAIPRTLSRAQTMDALSSQANTGGYKAVLIAANTYGRYFPLLTTAAGTAKPANVLILGIGVAGLQAIGTARRLGAVVSAYDVRPETAEQAQSLGAKFVKLRTAIDATGAGGYARELTAEERAAQQAELNEVIAEPGRDHHDRPGPGPQATGPGHRGRGPRHALGLRHRGHGRERPGWQLRAERGRRDDRHPERRDHRGPGEPAGLDALFRVPVLRPQHLVPAAEHGQGRQPQPRLRGGGHEGDRDHPRRSGRLRGRAASSSPPPEAPHERRRRVHEHAHRPRVHDLRARDPVRRGGHLQGSRPPSTRR